MRIRAALGLCVYMLSIATLLIALIIALQVLRGPALTRRCAQPTFSHVYFAFSYTAQSQLSFLLHMLILVL